MTLEFANMIMKRLDALSEKLSESSEKIARFEGAALEKQLDRIENKISSLEAKVIHIEQRQNVIYGVAAAAATIGAFVAGVFKMAIDFFSKFWSS